MPKLIPFTLLIFTLAGSAAGAAPLKWADVRSMALDKNPALRGANQREQSSRAELKGSYGNFLPDLGVNASRFQRNEVINGGAQVVEPRDSAGFNANLNLFAGGATLAEVKRARANLMSTRADRDLTSADLRQRLRQAFFEVSFQQDRIGLYERIVTRLQQNERIIQLKYDTGAEARWNVQKTTADVRRAEQNLLSARNGLKIARDQLAALLYLDSLPEGSVEPLKIEDAAFDLGSPDDLSKVHPTVRKAEAQAEVADRYRTTARSALLPALDLTYYDYRERERAGNLFRKRETRWAVNATWNIFNGLTDYYKLQQANLNFEAADLQRLDDSRRVLTEVRTGATNFETARAALPVARSQREAAEERVKTVRTQYRTGLKTYIDWEQSESQLIEAEEAEVTAIRTALFAL
ncbi:MAG: TolC family protein, partial [Proteobacteria bacterium]